MENGVNRRNFLKTGGIVLSGFTMGLSALHFEKAMAANDIVQLGVIGTGSRGTGLIRTLKNIPGIRVTACCDVLPFRLDGAMQYADKKAKAYDNHKALLDDKRVDAVIISTPLSMHKSMAFDAIDAGKHIYLEKTMTKEIDEALALVEKVNKSKKIFQIGHQYHSSRLYANIVKTIKKGYIGEIKSFEAQWNRNGNWRRVVPEEGLERQINWRMYREFSNGLLGELSSHQIDFVNWVTNSHPERVVGTGGIDYWKDGRETYDNVRVVFDYPAGVKASFTCLTSNAYEGYQIKVQGDKATVVIKPTSALIYPEQATKKELGMVDGVSGATVPTMNKEGAIPVNGTDDDPTGQALIDFADSIKNNTEPISNVKTGAKAAISVRMALESVLKKKTIKWADSYNIS
ncbi:MAG: Gfo/Idh/MocA family oxidoreductase [Cytophagales bacterium]|nr:Gfo/Idh/MocA family oxidoreductase [Cytophagales bacterium]